MSDLVVVDVAVVGGVQGHLEAVGIAGFLQQAFRALDTITDALFGAAAMGDIGFHFPDTDAQYKGADSTALLAEAARRVRAAGWAIGNVDSTVIAQAPKMAPHILAMRQRVAQALAVAVDQVSVKAKTAEQMGPVGLGQAIEARAVCMLWRS